MAISAQDVKRLREVTGVGMMDCKRALEESSGDFEAAIDLLRKKGQKVAAKRADREAKEGLIVAALDEGGRRAALAEVNCETDFVARNEDFAAFASEVADIVLRESPADLEALRNAAYRDGQTLGEAVTEMTGKIGEKIDIRRFRILESTEGSVVSYIHPGSRLGVLVDISSTDDTQEVGRDVAMQVAALNPIASHREEVPEEVQQKELEIGRDTARNEGKPEHIIDRIAQGKLERYFKDNVLIEQPFVKDASVTVQDMLKSRNATVRSFVRFALGD